jgi:hypothetical protein
MTSIINISVCHGHEGHSALSEWLATHLGSFGVFADEVILHSLIELIKLLPFLFLTYLAMEFIEHKMGDKTADFMKRAGKLGPAVGGALGLLPQCGFSSVASSFFAAKIISLGTLVAVFLATSDEMLPILIGNPDISITTILFILVYKLICAIGTGFLINAVLHLMKKDKEDINVDEICDNDNCHCERGIFYSAMHHTISISLFVLAASVIIGTLVFFVGTDKLALIMYDKPVISHLICAIFGLIPNCAASVALTEFYTEGLITLGSMLSGLFSGGGVGLLVLFKQNRHLKTNLAIVGILIASGFVFGLLADLTGLSSVFG